MVIVMSDPTLDLPLIDVCCCPRQRPMAGSGSDGTEDSDSSAEREQTNSSESDGNMPKRQRLTRASTRLSQSSQGSSVNSINTLYCDLRLRCLISTLVFRLTFLQTLQIWSEPQTTMSLLRWRPRGTPPPLNPSWTSPAPTRRTTRARPKTRPAETRTRTCPTGPSGGAVTRPTTSTWSVPRRDATRSVKPLWKCWWRHRLYYLKLPQCHWIKLMVYCPQFVQVTSQENMNGTLLCQVVLCTTTCLLMSARWGENITQSFTVTLIALRIYLHQPPSNS